MTEETDVAPEAANEEVVQESTEVPEQKPWDDETEQFARMIGWKAPDEWQGEKPAGYMDNPTDYVERAKSILPFRKLEEQFTGLQKTLDQRISGIESAYQKAVERERQRASQTIKALQERQMKAFDEGDKEAFEQARKAEDNIRASLQEPEQPQPQQAEIPPEVRDALDNWRVDNDWFGQDQERTQAATAAWSEAEKMGIRNPQAILRFVDKKIGEQFPAQKPQQRQQAAFEDGALALGGGAEPFSKLPKEAKDAFKRMVKSGLFEDTKEGRAQYVKDYEDA